MHLNVASLQGAHKFDMLRLHLTSSDIDIFCASEPWLTQATPDELVKIEGYNLMRWDHA